MITVACVLRSGGPYDVGYVRALYRGVRRHLVDVSYAFVCLTDRPELVRHSGINAAALEHGWPRWWSKMELFAIPGPVLYLDLDTVVCGKINLLAHAINYLEWSDWIMLSPFRSGRAGWASGVMGWRGDARWMYEAFAADPDDNMKTFPRRGDQWFITQRLEERGITPADARGWVQIDSWKRSNCAPDGPRGGARLVCFHGRPRPHEVRDNPWMTQHWHPEPVQISATRSSSREQPAVTPA